MVSSETAARFRNVATESSHIAAGTRDVATFSSDIAAGTRDVSTVSSDIAAGTLDVATVSSYIAADLSRREAWRKHLLYKLFADGTATADRFRSTMKYEKYPYIDQIAVITATQSAPRPTR